MSQLRKGESIRRATLLDMRHQVRPKLMRISGTWACHLRSYQTGECLAEGVGNTEDEAFKDAYNKFEARPKPQEVAEENEALRKRIRDLESGVQSKSTSSESPAADSNTEADSPKPAPVKKKRGRPKSKRGPLDLPDIDNPDTFPEANEPQVKID